jgi:hypothetical protein
MVADALSNRTLVNLSVMANDGTSRAELERFGRQLNQRIRELKVESISNVDPPPISDGAKVGEAITFTSLAIAILPSLLPKLIDVVRDILKSKADRQVLLRIGDVSVTLPHDASQADVANAAAVLDAAIQQNSLKL